MSGRDVESDEPFWVPRDPRSAAFSAADGPQRASSDVFDVEATEPVPSDTTPHGAPGASEGVVDAEVIDPSPVAAARPPVREPADEGAAQRVGAHEPVPTGRRRATRLPPARPRATEPPVVPAWVEEDEDDLVGPVDGPGARSYSPTRPVSTDDDGHDALGAHGEEPRDGAWASAADASDQDDGWGDDLLDLVRAADARDAAEPLDLLDLVRAEESDHPRPPADAPRRAAAAGVFDIEAVDDGGMVPVAPAGLTVSHDPEPTPTREQRVEAAVPSAGPADPQPDATPGGEVEAAVEGESWSFEGDTPDELAWAPTDTSPVPASEMTGIWLTTQTGRESPVLMDGQPVDVRDLDIPADLRDRLRDWADLWDREWDPAQGWRPRARIGDYEALGRWLARAVKDEVGAIDVTLELAHLGRSGVERIAPAEQREPTVVVLRNEPGVLMPVWGDFVTDAGVGSFSSELNMRLEAWAEDYAWALDHPGLLDRGEERATYEQRAHDLAAEMEAELGPDYRVRLELPELR